MANYIAIFLPFFAVWSTLLSTPVFYAKDSLELVAFG